MRLPLRVRKNPCGRSLDFTTPDISYWDDCIIAHKFAIPTYPWFAPFFLLSAPIVIYDVPTNGSDTVDINVNFLEWEVVC